MSLSENFESDAMAYRHSEAPHHSRVSRRAHAPELFRVPPGVNKFREMTSRAPNSGPLSSLHYARFHATERFEALRDFVAAGQNQPRPLHTEKVSSATRVSSLLSPLPRLIREAIAFTNFFAELGEHEGLGVLARRPS
jgi:hypothetical protein